MFCTLENIQGRERATTGYGCPQRTGRKDFWRKSPLSFRRWKSWKKPETVQTFQKVDTSLEDDFHGYFLACDISIISRQIVSNLILEPLHYWLQTATEEVIGSILFFSQFPLPLSSLKNLPSHFPPACLHVHLILQVAALLTGGDETAQSRSSSTSFFPLDGAMGFPWINTT